MKNDSLNQAYRKKYACDDEWIKTFLTNIEIGHVATHWDNQPFITPVLFYYDLMNNEISFHTNIVGRLKANAERHPEVCFEASRMGKLLPSNIASEFALQYESVVVFGKIRLISDLEEKQNALSELIRKYFPNVSLGIDYKPIAIKELNRTAVFKIEIDSWSGKRNWPDKAKQDPEWNN